MIKRIWIYLLVCTAAFYLLPLTGRFWHGEGTLVLLALIILPLVTLLTSLVYGIKNGFNLFLPVFIGIIYLPTLFIFYNYTAWIFAVVYIATSLIGNGIGRAFHKQRT